MILHPRSGFPVARSRRSVLSAALAVLAGHACGADAPSRGVLVCGDSMVKALSRSLTREFAAVPSVSLSHLVSIGTGLARPDVFDWPAKVREAAQSKPEAVVLMLGANDGQNLRTATGAVVHEGAADWSAEYAARVADVLRQLKAAGVRHILWIGLPDMREHKLQADCQRINAILRSECGKVDGAQFFDITPLFSPKPGVYSAYVVRPGGRPVLVRSSDGGHLNPDGADILARAVRERLATLMSF